jgi:hypothetical protein
MKEHPSISNSSNPLQVKGLMTVKALATTSWAPCGIQRAGMSTAATVAGVIWLVTCVCILFRIHSFKNYCHYLHSLCPLFISFLILFAVPAAVALIAVLHSVTYTSATKIPIFSAYYWLQLSNRCFGDAPFMSSAGINFVQDQHKE